MCNICGAWPEKNNPPSQTSGNITLHNAHCTLQCRSLARYKHSHAVCINQAQAIVWNWGVNYRSGLPHLDTALCPWSPALSAECQMTTHPTWWWTSRIGQPRGRSTLLGIWHLKAIVTHYFKYSSSRCLMWIISDTSQRCISNPALALNQG